MFRISKSFIIILLGVSFSILFLRYFQFPFFWILALWFSIFILAAISTAKSYIKLISFNLSAIIFIFGIFEIYFWNAKHVSTASRPSNKQVERKWINNKYPLQVRDSRLGIALMKNASQTAVSYKNGRVIYKVTYTTDENGLRISPNHKYKNRVDMASILFFGGSFTFGEGVNDNETMPYVTGILTGEAFSIYNFAVHGYGPQHMLAQIEQGIIDLAIRHKPRYSIYLVIPDHVNRLAAIYPWHKYGPIYYTDSNGNIKLQSKLAPNRIWLKINNQIRKSYFLSNFTRNIENKTSIINKSKLNKKHMIDFFVRVVDNSRNYLLSKYPANEFHVIFWDEKDNGYSEAIIDALTKKKIINHRVSSIIKEDYTDSNKNPYRIPYDGHPSPLAYRILADYVVSEIVNKKPKEYDLLNVY